MDKDTMMAVTPELQRARAICARCAGDAGTINNPIGPRFLAGELDQHHEWEKWPVDERREYVDAISGEPRVSLMHRGWRKRTAHARTALSAAMGGE